MEASYRLTTPNAEEECDVEEGLFSNKSLGIWVTSKLKARGRHTDISEATAQRLFTGARQQHTIETLAKATDLVTNPVLTANNIYANRQYLKACWRSHRESHPTWTGTYKFVKHSIQSIRWADCWLLQEMTSPTCGIQSENGEALCRGPQRSGHLPPLQERLRWWKGST